MQNKWEIGQWYKSNVATDSRHYRYIGFKSDGAAVFECPEIASQFKCDGFVTTNQEGFPRGCDSYYQITTEKVKQKIKVELTLNIYEDGEVVMYRKKERAALDPRRLACKHISFEIQEGEGL